MSELAQRVRLHYAARRVVARPAELPPPRPSEPVDFFAEPMLVDPFACKPGGMLPPHTLPPRPPAASSSSPAGGIGGGGGEGGASPPGASSPDDRAPLDVDLDELIALLDELTVEYEDALRPTSRSRRFEESLAYAPPTRGAVMLANIRRNLMGFRDAQGKPMRPAGAQLQIIEELLACAAPLIFGEEFDANPELIYRRYGWPHTDGIMSILMPRKWGKSTIVAMVVIAIMMEYPSFRHLNISLTVPQGKIITDMIKELLPDHDRVRRGEFTVKPYAQAVELITPDGNIRLSECVASKVRRGVPCCARSRLEDAVGPRSA